MSKSQPYREIEHISELPNPDKTGHVTHCVFQSIDFNEAGVYASSGEKFTDCCFLGCSLPHRMQETLGPGCTVFPKMDLTYDTYRGDLYDGDSLFEGFDPRHEETFETCYDTIVYKDFIARGKEPRDIIDALGRSLHGHAISDAMGDFLSLYDEKKVVAVMGGHALQRTDASFREVALLSKHLTEKGRLMCSGGGPGAMEATHFGAWMAGYTDAQLDEALSMLSPAPGFRDPGWLRTAFEVRLRFPRKEEFCSLGIPTFFYGHEPTTPFASHIAKYFQNSIREDILLTIAKGGIIYSPGSAGTVQEIFQDAAQNHYESFGYASPMVFLGKDFFTKEIPVYTFLTELLSRGKYKNLILSLADSATEAEEAILAFE